MNTKSIVGIVLIILGCVVLAYSGISFTTPGESIDLLGMHVETRESHFIPPVVGIVVLLGGIALLVMKPRSIG